MHNLLPQNGIGIDFENGAFQSTWVKRLWNRIRVAGRLQVPNYREVGPAECGRLYREFLRRNGLGIPWTVVALPRSSVLLRWLHFPRAVERELAKAVEYQLDSLHPFEEGSVYWDFAAAPQAQQAVRREGNSSQEPGSAQIEVALAIAQQQRVDEMAAWFEEAGIAVSQFSVTTALFLSMLRDRASGLATSPDGASFLLYTGGGRFELLGYAPGRGLVSRETALSASADGAVIPREVLERELERARSELRLDPSERPPLYLCGPGVPQIPEEWPFAVIPGGQLFPALRVAPEDFNLREHTVGFAAALAAAGRGASLSLNLLPQGKRAYRSPLVYVPTYALSGAVVLLLATLGVRGLVQDWLYSRYLQREIEVLRPRLAQVERAQDASRRLLERIALIQQARHAGQLPLEVLSELTRALPADAWLQQMNYEGDSLSLSGFAGSSSGLLQAVDASELFYNPQFLSAIDRTAQGEVFRIAARVQGGAR